MLGPEFDLESVLGPCTQSVLGPCTQSVFAKSAFAFLLQGFEFPSQAASHFARALKSNTIQET